MSSSAADLYPLKFSTIYIDKPWGGRTLEKFKGAIPDGLIGETWDVSAQSQGVSQVTNGPFAGQGLDEVTARLGRAMLGSGPQAEHFPLMVRYVSSRENLSVQVHPTREYALNRGELSGKDEAWYVLEAEPGAFVYAGVDPGVSVDRFRDSVHDGSVRDHLLARPVKPGDCLFIPAGTIHAIGAGITLIEICETSNTTYRVYDYGRNRGLDIEETFANMDLSIRVGVHRGLTRGLEAGHETVLCLQPTMAMSTVTVDGRQRLDTRATSFQVLSCLEGEGTLTGRTWSEATPIRQGESVVVPAEAEEFDVTGNLQLLRSWIPTDDEREELLHHVA